VHYPIGREFSCIAKCPAIAAPTKKQILLDEIKERLINTFVEQVVVPKRNNF
jgi:hypothetical protein